MILGAFELGTSDVGTVVVEPGKIDPVGLGKSEAWMVADGLGRSEGKVTEGLGKSEGKVTEGLGKSEGRVTEGLGKSEGVPVGPDTSVIFGAIDVGTSDVAIIVVEPGRIDPVGLGKSDA